MSLSDELSKWKKAYQEEFELTQNAASDEEFETLRIKLRRRVYQYALEAVDNIYALSKGSESDTVRAQCSKWLATQALGKEGASSPNEDPMEAMIKQLTSSKKVEDAS